MKKYILATSFALASLALVSCGTKQGSNGELYVYNWGEYIDESLIDEFEDKTGIKVIYDVFETNEEMYPIIEAGAVNYDVVCPSDYMIQKMIENDLLQEIDMSKLSNLGNMSDTYMDFAASFDPDNKYAIPYTWGTVGILYNTSMVDEAPDSWNVLWDEKYAGNILMQDSVRDAFMVGEKLLGYSLNETDSTRLAQVRDKLIAQKPLVQAYVIDQVRDKMIGGEAALAVIYSGEMLYVQKEVAELGGDFTLEYVIPKEGSNVWLDAWVIPKSAKNYENALKWIDFLLEAEVAKKNFEYITYPTPNQAAMEFLPEDIKNNKAIFPDESMLEGSEVYQYLGEEVDTIYNELWKEVKSK